MDPRPAVLVAVAACGAFALPAAAILAFLGPGRPWVGPARALASALGLLYLVNLTTVWAGQSWDPTAWFVAMNLGFAGIVGMTLAGVVLVDALIGRATGRLGLSLWASGALVFWLVGLYRALLVTGGSAGDVFAAGTLGAALATLGLGVRLVRGRRGLEPEARRGLGPVLVILGLLVALAVANEAAGPHVPLSPLFLVFGAVLVYGATFGTLTAPKTLVPDSDAWCRAHGLSDREREVLVLVASGLDRTAIADRLFISPVTVKNHLASLYRKTRTSDQASLSALGRSAGLVGPDQGV